MKSSKTVVKHCKHSWVGILGGFILSSIYPVFAQEENGELSFTGAVSTGAVFSIAAAAPVTLGINLSSKLSPAEGDKHDSFGASLAVSGDTLVAGHVFSRNLAYLFKRNSSSGPWSQVAKLEPPADTNNSARFGYSVAIDNDTVVVGAPDDTVNGVRNAGSTYLFKRNTSNPAQWDRIDRLTVEDLPPYRPVQYDYFGKTVAISGNTVAVLAPGVERSGKTTGAAYVFEPSGVTELTVTGGVHLGNASGDTHPLAISGDRIVIGDDTGSVYTFKHTPQGPWVQVGAALPGTPHSSERFGASLALKDNLLVVGAPKSDGAERDTGAVYVFESNPAGGWSQVAKLTASDGVEGDLFGAAVAVSDDGLILVGAPQKDSKAGAAYLFKQGACGFSWGQMARLTATDSQAGDDFANSVAFSGNTVLIGAPAINSPTGSSKPGAVYYHDLDLPTAYCLTVERTGTGAGTVTSTPPGGINCGNACAASYPDGTKVTLIATPDKGSIFKGWNGACSDTSPCQVTVTQALSVTAEFEDLPTLVVVKRGSGSSSSTPASHRVSSAAAIAPKTIPKGRS